MSKQSRKYISVDSIDSYCKIRAKLAFFIWFFDNFK